MAVDPGAGYTVNEDGHQIDITRGAATTHVPQQQPRTPPRSNHTPPPEQPRTHAHPPEQPCTPLGATTHPQATTHVPREQPRTPPC